MKRFPRFVCCSVILALAQFASSTARAEPAAPAKSAALAAPAVAETYRPFRADLPAGAAYSINAAQLHPTQFSLGLREVAAKVATINAKNRDALVAYLKKKDVPVVIGPGGVPYLTDGHHTLRSLLDSRQPDKTAYGHILVNWSNLDATTFWTRMAENNYTYLKDRTGRPTGPAQLPSGLLQMQSDPYRGLAWAVMNAGGFDERKNWFFQEFAWADFFREKIRWDDTNDADFTRAVTEATALARSPSAANLPGYKPQSPR